MKHALGSLPDIFVCCLQHVGCAAEAEGDAKARYWAQCHAATLSGPSSCSDVKVRFLICTFFKTPLQNPGDVSPALLKLSGKITGAAPRGQKLNFSKRNTT